MAERVTHSLTTFGQRRSRQQQLTQWLPLQMCWLKNLVMISSQFFSVWIVLNLLDSLSQKLCLLECIEFEWCTMIMNSLFFGNLGLVVLLLLIEHKSYFEIIPSVFNIQLFYSQFPLFCFWLEWPKAHLGWIMFGQKEIFQRRGASAKFNEPNGFQWSAARRTNPRSGRKSINFCFSESWEFKDEFMCICQVIYQWKQAF